MRNRTLLVLGGALAAAALALGTLGSAFAQTQSGQGWGPGWGPGMMGGFGPGGRTGGYGPGGMMGGYGPGGMMGGYGPGGMMGGYGPGGMMGGYGPGGMMGGWSGGTRQATPLTSLQDAQQAFQGYLDRLGNKDLALDEVMEFQNNFYAVVKEQSTGQGAFELLASKQTGFVFPEFGPNMMWNTKYGMMAGFGGMMGGYGAGGMMGGWSGATQAPTGQPTVSADQAQQIAQQWLDQNQPGSTTEKPDVFPGYYTVHTLKDGKITGMLSVNAYTGAVWYHTWHGAFVASTEVGQ